MILSLETATSACSVALHAQGVLQSSSTLLIERAASSKLAVMIQEILKRCDVTPDRLQAIAVSSGPGSYTGLRVGIATAKGLCYSLHTPLIAIGTLQALTKQIIKRKKNVLLCPMIDARRMEVYTMIGNGEGEILEPIQAKIVEKNSFDPWLANHKIVFFGDGMDKCARVIQHPNAVFLPDVIPNAVEIGELAFEKFQKKQFEDSFNFEPHYLKDFLLKTKQKSTTHNEATHDE